MSSNSTATVPSAKWLLLGLCATFAAEGIFCTICCPFCYCYFPMWLEHNYMKGMKSLQFCSAILYYSDFGRGGYMKR